MSAGLRDATGAARLELRRDGNGRPLVSGTFVLERPPDPAERLGPLVRRAVLALDAEVVLGRADPVLDTTIELRRLGENPLVLASTKVDGPFTHGALQATIDGPVAAEVLEGLLGGPEPIEVVGRSRLVAGSIEPSRVRVHLGRLWTYLDAVADGSRRFLRIDLLNYLPRLVDQGIVRVESGSTAAEPVLAAVLRAAAWVLPAETLELTGSSPGDQEAVAASQVAGGVPGPTLECRAALDQLVGPLIAHEREHHIHLVSESGGELSTLLPVRTVRRSRGPESGRSVQVASRGRVVAVGSVLRPKPAVATALMVQPMLAHPDRPQLVSLGTLELVDDAAPRRPGPLVDRLDAALWTDRWEQDRAWYLPEFTVVEPDPVAPVDVSPFRFDIEGDTGHRLDGSTGIVASITMQLRAGQSAQTVAAWEAAGRPGLDALALSSVLVQLAVPFRDEHGASQVERVSAESVESSGPIGADGSSVIARFRLLDDWARLAYGALSTPDFQQQPAAMVISVSFEGWQAQRRRPTVLGLDKRWALSGFASSGRARPAPGATAAIHSTALATASIRPAWQIRPDLLDRLDRTTYEWVQLGTSRSIPVFASCATYGALYRERRDGDWQAIGCRPALQLGATEYRTYELVDLTAAAGVAQVYRSLRVPGRFLVVPTEYAVGRYAPGENDRPYQPRLLLHSTIDIEDPSNIRCVLSAALEPVLAPFQRAAILAELRRTVHPEPKLEYLPDTGVSPEIRWAVPAQTEVDCLANATGFDVLCSTDVAGFLTVKSLIERDGLRGSATVDLPGGVRLATSLRIGLSDVTGPFDTGAIELDRQSLTATNRTGQRVALLALASGGSEVARVDRILAPQEAIDCPQLATGPLDAVYQLDSGNERLEEIRAYIEDLDIGVLFVATADPAAAGLAGLEINTAFLGREDSDVLLLTATAREAERRYVLPLTSFAGDPVLEFTVTAVGTDGTRKVGRRTSWPVRSRGALVPIGPPE
ncbi:MAG: hypothetical protein ACXWW7_03820 [Nocardioides sp.]